MLSNLWAFIKGALGGLLGCIGFAIIGFLAGMDFSTSQWLFYWFFTVAFFGGFITAVANTGYGLISMILFVVLGVVGMNVFAILAVVSMFESGSGLNGMAISSLAVTGILLFRWYTMIGKGEAESPWLLAFLAVLIGMAAGYFLADAIGEVLLLVISAVIDGACLITMLVLRIKNGSAMDY